MVNKQIRCIEELHKCNNELAMFNQVNQRNYDSELEANERRIQDIENEVLLFSIFVSDCSLYCVVNPSHYVISYLLVRLFVIPDKTTELR